MLRLRWVCSIFHRTGIFRAVNSGFRVLMHLHRAPGFVGSVANIFERAVDALGFAGDAEAASMPDDLVSEENPLFARDDAHQILLDLLRIVVGGEFEASRDAVYMGIDD